eukprot:TRINITY_DN32829_c0_g1_i1.p1 TRINITY_DN32829_c0_g1~~TRINITY_DN32829_c0_g1_i1.p1  ORF type:complete len:579 (-),score=121.40 TRINITY_DN32829_c0_g1_i1:141-1877(-)
MTRTRSLSAAAAHSVVLWLLGGSDGILAASAADGTPVVVNTTLGAVRGRCQREAGDGSRLRGYCAFKGLPYAEAPGRFEHARAKRPWTGVLDASAFGDACIGAIPNAWSGLYGCSEDCLYANVWLPAEAFNDKDGLPVVVFIHGGGFMMRSGGFPPFWGDTMASDIDRPVVHVTFNYRLGIFGFMSHEETDTNFGFVDQQLALKWVRSNIHAFGGDPKRVTLVGQSAGAMSVFVHLTAPGSQGLFQRAFLASNVGLHYRNLTENAAFVRSTAKAVACFESATLVECLRSRPAFALGLAQSTGELWHAVDQCPHCVNILPWLPVVDGRILEKPPLEVVEAGKSSRVPVVVSSVRNESLAFLPSVIQAASRIPGIYGEVLKVFFKDKAKAVEDFYAGQPGSAALNKGLRLSEVISDALFGCHARYVSRVLAKTGNAPTFRSLFLHAPSQHADPTNGKIDGRCEAGATCHAGDIAFMFSEGRGEARRYTGLEFTEEEEQLAENYSYALRSFAYGDSSAWSLYDWRLDNAVAWDTGRRNVTAYRGQFCDFLEKEVGVVDKLWHVAHSTTVVAVGGDDATVVV